MKKAYLVLSILFVQMSNAEAHKRYYGWAEAAPVASDRLEMAGSKMSNSEYATCVWNLAEKVFQASGFKDLSLESKVRWTWSFGWTNHIAASDAQGNRFKVELVVSTEKKQELDTRSGELTGNTLVCRLKELHLKNKNGLQLLLAEWDDDEFLGDYFTIYETEKVSTVTSKAN